MGECFADLVDAYNKAKHSSIGMAPSEALLPTKRGIVFKKLYGVSGVKEYFANQFKKYRLKTGDIVRMPYKIKSFDKSYYPKWEDVVKKVQLVKKGYKVPGLKIENADGNRYVEEVQKVIPTTFRVEPILKRKIVGKTPYVLVKWLNYGPEHNTWEKAKNVFDL